VPAAVVIEYCTVPGGGGGGAAASAGYTLPVAEPVTGAAGAAVA